MAYINFWQYLQKEVHTSHQFDGCFDTAGGKIQVNGIRIIEVNDLEPDKYNLIVMLSSDPAIPVWTKLTTISGMTQVECIGCC